MPDNSKKIADIKAILEAGATTVSAEGVTVTYDFEQLRRQLRQLQLDDDSLAGRRPKVSTINLNGSF